VCVTSSVARLAAERVVAGEELSLSARLPRPTARPHLSQLPPTLCPPQGFEGRTDSVPDRLAAMSLPSTPNRAGPSTSSLVSPPSRRRPALSPLSTVQGSSPAHSFRSHRPPESVSGVSLAPSRFTLSNPFPRPPSGSPSLAGSTATGAHAGSTRFRRGHVRKRPGQHQQPPGPSVAALASANPDEVDLMALEEPDDVFRSFGVRDVRRIEQRARCVPLSFPSGRPRRTRTDLLAFLPSSSRSSPAAMPPPPKSQSCAPWSASATATSSRPPTRSCACAAPPTSSSATSTRSAKRCARQEQQSTVRPPYCFRLSRCRRSS